MKAGYIKQCPCVTAPGISETSEDHFNSLSAQRSRILKHLQRGFPITTLEARKDLDILHPAGRIMELRKSGHTIVTTWQVESTNFAKHRIAKYFLAGGEHERS